MALDCLASWLVEGSPSIEAALAAPGPGAQIKAIFQAHAGLADLEGVAHMLDALFRMLKHSPKLTVRAGCLRAPLAGALFAAMGVGRCSACGVACPAHTAIACVRIIAQTVP